MTRGRTVLALRLPGDSVRFSTELLFRTTYAFEDDEEILAASERGDRRYERKQIPSHFAFHFICFFGGGVHSSG